MKYGNLKKEMLSNIYHIAILHKNNNSNIFPSTGYFYIYYNFISVYESKRKKNMGVKEII